ncbi:discoidin domain-containing protein [Actinomadura alba]|uniref:Discoidin domain-containing protein n=2 Tax=Actinomadura alba TaxID=406431 RepID=A0ABR7LLH4_9ACTN|nr:discoidin domain-containing protein [Actinomadura alba]
MMLIALVFSLVTALPSLMRPAAAEAVAESPFDVPGRGATVPFTEIEAEDAATNGELIGPDRVYTRLPSEASGRRAVRLSAAGQYVEFTLTKPANAMSVRYSVPDNAAGTGLTAPVDLRINGTKLKDLSFTSRYGWYYGGYPFGNNPGAGSPHHFYDETRTMFGSTLAAGTKVRVQVASTSISPWFVVDLADFELVPDPIARPSGSLSVEDYGADRTGAADSTAAVQAAVDAGRTQGRVVWIPQGTFKVTNHIIVDNVTLRGAGPWYSVLGGNRVGVYGKYVADGGPSRNVQLRDFAIMGEVTERNDGDQVNAIGGAMSDSVVSNVWMQHNKVGAWMDGPMNNFTITGSRILDQTADGVNFHRGVTNSTVTNTFVRNMGDDGLAMWAETDNNVGNRFTFNTVVVPVLANNIAIYGGRDITVSDNVLTDTVTNGGGLHVGNRYPGVNGPTAVSGTFTLARNTLIRAGNSDYNWNFGVGAIWFNGLNQPISGAAINVTDTDVLDSSYAAIHTIEGSVTGVNFNNVNIDGTGTFALQLQAPGSASFTNVRAQRIGYSGPIYSCLGNGFTINQGSGNSGWYTSTPYCGPWPAPVYGGGGGDPTPTPPGCQVGTGNVAARKPISASGHTQSYVAANANDGDSSSYWESPNNAFPQTLTVDLCGTVNARRVVLKLPPSAAWATRTQTIAVLGSANGTDFSTLAGAAGRTFDPATGNTATITLPGTGARYLRLNFTGNTGWPAGQASEFEVYAS